MKALFVPLRYLGNTLLALFIFALSLLLLLAGYVAFYLPMWETAGLEEGAPAGAWMWIDERPIYYRTWGSQDDPTVVLVHGDVVEGSRIWDANASTLADAGLYVIAVDLLGYGHSERITEANYTLRAHTGVVALLLNELRVSEATLVGHGQGAGVVLQLAAEQPQFVGNMVLISPDIDSRDGPLWRLLARQPHIGRAVVWAVESGGPLWKWQRTRMVADADRYPAEYMDAARQPARIAATAESLRMMALSQPDDNLPEAIDRLGMPAIILRGDQDRTCSEEQVQELASLFPDARVVAIPGAGHAAQIDQPGIVNAEIARAAGIDLAD